MQPNVPKRFNITVPDLSSLRAPKIDLDKPLVAAVVRPGDQVMVLLPAIASQQEVEQISQALKQWNPVVNFLVMAGPESITVIPAAPIEDKEPQGQKPFFEQVYEVKKLVEEANVEHDDSNCPGPPMCM